MSTVKMSYREALRQAHREALQKNPQVFLMGEDVGRYGGTYAVSKGLVDEFGSERVRNTPLSEATFVGAGIGAAIDGMRPIVEIMTVNFSLLALDQIINSAATLRHMSGGQVQVPLIIRMATGAGRQVAAQHSHSFEGWYAHIPGIKILTPATVQDARWMIGQALEDPNPVLMFEHTTLYNLEEEFDVLEKPLPHYKSAVRRKGTDLTIISYGACLQKSMKASALLEAEGVQAEIIDLRSLRPLDNETILNSLYKTGRGLIIDEGWRSGGISAEIMARIMESDQKHLIKALHRLCSEEVPIPYPKHLEDAVIPQVEGIVQFAKQIVRSHV